MIQYLYHSVGVTHCVTPFLYPLFKYKGWFVKMIIGLILYLCMSYMFFLMFTSSAFMCYELRSNGYTMPGRTFNRNAVKDPYEIRKPLFIFPLTSIGYKCYNVYHKLSVNVQGIQVIDRCMYRIGIYFYKSIVVKCIYMFMLLSFGACSISIGTSLFQLIMGLIGIFDLFMVLYCILQTSLKYSYQYEKHMFINYLLIYNGFDFWKKHRLIRRANYNINVYPKKKMDLKRNWSVNSEYKGDDVSIDQSIFRLNERHNPTRGLPVISPVVLSLAINNELQSNKQCMGGINMYQSVQFVKIDDRNYMKSQGMMTYLDGYDLVPKGHSLRDIDKNKAFSLRRKSKVPGLYEDSKCVFDRTHLVHHRLSGCEGGLGTMVPMFKSVNTGTNSMFHGKVTGTPVKNSMKYYEDFAIDYLIKHQDHSILYVADPYYIRETDVVPSHVKIRIYRIAKYKPFLLKEGKVYNAQYLFNKDKDIKFDVDYQTGHITYH